MITQSKYFEGEFKSSRTDYSILQAVLLAIALTLGAFHNFMGVFTCMGIFLFVAIKDKLVLQLDRITINLLLIAFILLLVNSFPGEASYLLKLEGIVRFSGFVFFAYLIYKLNMRARVYAVFAMASLILLTMLLYFVFGMFTINVQGAMNRFGSIFIHSNHNAYVSLYLLMAIYIIREKFPLNNLERNLSTILGFGLVMSVLLTKSSGGLIVLGAFSASVFLVSRNASFIFKALFIAFVMLAVFFLGEAVQLTMEKFSDVDLSLIQQRAESLKFGGYGSLAWRLGYWLAIYNAFIASDLSVIMHGFGTGVMSKGNYLYFFMDKDPHNDFLLLFVENGAIGLTSVFLVLLNLVRKMEFRWLVGFALFLPMLWGNIISSFPVFSAYILMLGFYKKTKNF